MYTHYANFQFNCTLDFFFAIIFLPQKILRNPTQIHHVSFPPTQFVLLFRMNPALYLVPILLLQGGRTFPQILMSLFCNSLKFILVSYPQTLKYEIKVRTVSQKTFCQLHTSKSTLSIPILFYTEKLQYSLERYEQSTSGKSSK